MIFTHGYKTLYCPKSAFQLSVLQPNPKWSQLPTIELRVETANLLEARENASDQVVFGFSFTFDWYDSKEKLAKSLKRWKYTNGPTPTLDLDKARTWLVKRAA